TSMPSRKPAAARIASAISSARAEGRRFRFFRRRTAFLMRGHFVPERKAMSKPLIFIQVHGQPGILEAELSDAATLGELHDAVAAAGVKIDAETFIFVDEAEHHLHGQRHEPIGGIKHGCRVHVSRCRKIKTTVHFLNKTAEHEFPPGTRVRAVKAWAVD